MIPRRVPIGASTILALALAAASPAAAIDPIASAVDASQSAIGQLSGSQVTIIRGSQLYEGQTITTNANGEVQVLFNDGTHMVIGHNSTLTIERYLMRNANTVSNLAVNAITGTFRFLTGNSPSDAYQINTPAGTIGSRGTQFDFTVDSSIPGQPRLDVIAYFGTVYACGQVGACILLDAACEVGSIMSGNPAVPVDQERQRAATAQAKFPYANSRTQNGLDRSFRVANASDCLVERAAITRTESPSNQAPGQNGGTPPEPNAPPEPTPPEPDPPPEEACSNNNGIGNGGECGEDGEGGNPGQGQGGGNGNGHTELVTPDSAVRTATLGKWAA